MSKPRRSRTGKITTHAILLMASVVMLFPFYWMLVMASNPTSEILRFPPAMTFGAHFFTNVSAAFEAVDLTRAIFNSVFVAVTTTALVLLFDSLAAFVFAKFSFPGKRVLFAILLATFLVPVELSIVPLFTQMASLGWVNTYQALIVPSMVNAYGIFWLRQYAARAVPSETLDAARIDGAGFLRQYWNIALPVIRPGLAFLGIFTFIAVWNDYLWPLVILNDPSKATVQLALAHLNSAHQFTDYSMVIAATFVTTIPLLAVFVIGARQFIGNLMAGSVKG